MRNKWFAGAALLALSGLAVSAHADPAVNYDTSLPTSPGVYYGNVPGANSLDNTNWAVVEDGNVTLGLQALTRFVGPIAPVTPGTNTYEVSTGTGSFGPLWGFAFSVLDPAGVSNLTLTLTFTDAAQDSTQSFSALIADDGAYDGTPGDTTYNCSTASSAACTSPTGIQNAENPSFAFVDPAYDPWIADNYTITLTASDDEQQLGSVSINVNTVPEPVSLSLLGAGLAGVAAVRRRKKVIA